MTDAATTALAGALQDRYTIQRELGRGGMATVYLAQDLKHDRPVALKVLHPELAATLGPDRFLREIRLAARLQHPHILAVLDSGEAAGRLWFTMPYVEGESLRDRLVRERQLPVADAVRITAEAALALDFAHRHGVIHRDIKPENILLCDGQALVADFGVGRALGLSSPEHHLTETGTVVGTPAYMSPEQASGERSLDGRTDVYSLGLVLYEMLAGEAPFAGPTAQAILSRRLTETPRPIRHLRDTVPEAVEQAALKALAKTPADRFQTAAELAHALTAQPTPPSAPGGAYVPARGRRTGRAIAAAAGALLLAGVLAVLAVRGRKAEPSPLDPNLVAVAPFDVLQPSLELWREGLVDLLARNLDGAGPLRTVSPTLVVRRWEGRADRASATSLATGAGAGLAIYGTLVGTGRDSVRLTASVLDVGRGEVIGEAELRGTAERMDQVADSLTVRVIRELAQSRPIGAARSSGLGSRSLPALRSFLRAEQFFRRTEWDSARTSYERAITLDSAFALAYWRLATIRGWQNGVDDSLSHALSRRAAAMNHGLAPRESLLVVCDSLLSSLVMAAMPDSEARQNLQRLFSAAERVTTQYPTDPEAWVALGEARVHFGYGMGVSTAMMLEPYERATTLDSSYAPAYIHPIEMALRLNDEFAARRYTDRYLALRPGGQQAFEARVTSRLLSEGVASVEMSRLLDTLPVKLLHGVWLNFWTAPDSAEIGIELSRRWADRHVPEHIWFSPVDLRQGLLAATLAFRGHLEEGSRVVMSHPKLRGWALFTELALAGAIPADTADAFYHRRLGKEPFWSPEDPAEQEGLVWAPVWWAGRADTSSIKRYLERLNWRAHSDTAPTGAVTNPYWLAAGEARLALARGDTAAALTRFAALPNTSGPVWFDRLTLARLLVAKGRDREALAVLDREFPFPWATASHGIWALERARLAEKLGEREKASQWYGYVVALWRHADPVLQPSVAEAREALARLTAEAGS